MQLKIKQFAVDMEIKTKGVEVEVRNPQGTKQLGDLLVKKSGLTWCRGKTSEKYGKRVSWDKFIEWMEKQG